MFSLIPKEMIFFDLFEEAAKNAHQGALALVDLLENYTNIPDKVKRIKDIEHAGDKITHTTIEKLNQTFITPLDREDIHELICRLDDIIDLIDTAVARMHLYKIDKPTEDAKALGRVLVKATQIIMELLPKMRNLKLSSSLLQDCIAIHTQENEGDRIEQHALASLFENGHDPIFIIKWKDIYEELESATDRCEDVANVIEGIVLKNA
jgi:predicted phosphate transport protein (TIGR00153 family)